MEKSSNLTIDTIEKTSEKMSKFELRKPVSPYICSTPLDFSEERDYLAKVIFPQLNAFCEDCGSHFSPVDLTWKPEDQKTEGGLLLKTQLDLIKKCSPFFICLLGETYGPYKITDDLPHTLPTSRHNLEFPETNDWLNKNLLLAGTGGHPWVLQKGHQTCSITELEVTQATFFCDNQHATLYYRQSDHLDFKLQTLKNSNQASKREEMIILYSSESETSKVKIHDLRQRLINKGVPVKYFKTVEELGQLVLEDWLEIINIVLPPLLHDVKLLDTFEYKEWQAQESFILNHSVPFVSGADMEETLQQMTEFALACSKAEIRDEPEPFTTLTTGSRARHYSMINMFQKSHPAATKSVMLLNGDRGVGKSALSAYWLQEFKKDSSHICVISHFISASSNSADIVHFLQKSVRQLRTKYLLLDSCNERSICSEIENESDREDKSFQSLCEAFKAAINLGPCVILMDGINELTCSHGISRKEVKKFAWLPESLPATCRFILTTSRSDITFHCLAQRQNVTVVNFPASLTNIDSMIMMVREHQPTVSQLMGGEIGMKRLDNLKIMQTALGSRLMTSEMACYRVYKNIDVFIENCGEIWSLREFWIMCVQSWVQEHSWTLDNPSSEISFADSKFDYTGWVTDSLCLIGVSRNGLTQNQILSILQLMGYVGDLEVTVYDWLQFRQALSATLREVEDGRLVFAHRYLQEIAEYLMFKNFSSVSYDLMSIMKLVNSEKRQSYHSHLARFFSQQPLNNQVLSELPWQLMLSGKIDNLVNYLTEYSVLLKLLVAGNGKWQKDMNLYWSFCQLHGHHPGSAYLQLAQTLGVVNVAIEETSTDLVESMFVIQGGIDCSFPTQGRTDLGLPTQGRTDLGLPTQGSTDLGLPTQGSTDLGFPAQGRTDLGFPKHVLDGDNKNVSEIAFICWHLAILLQELDQTEVSQHLLLSSLVKYIKQKCPLIFEHYLLLCQCHHAVGKLRERMGDNVAAEKEYRLALHALAAAEDRDDDLTYQKQTKYLKGVVLNCHANLRIQEEEKHDAEELLKEALECIEESPDCFVLRSTIYFNLGLLSLSKSDYQRAESCLRESYKLRSQWFGRCHPLVAKVLVALAQVLASANHIKGQNVMQAEMMLRQALSIEEKCLGESSLSVASILFDLGQLLVGDQSHHARAEGLQHLCRSLDIRTIDLGGHHPITKATQQSLTRFDVAVKLGYHDSGLARNFKHRSSRTQFCAPSFRANSLAWLCSRKKKQTLEQVDNSTSISAGNRYDKTLRQERSYSFMSNVISLTSASERLLSAPIGNQPRLLRREQKSQSHQAIQSRHQRRQDAMNTRHDVCLDSLNSEGKRTIVGNDTEYNVRLRNQKDEHVNVSDHPDENETIEWKDEILVAIQPKEDHRDEANKDITVILDTARTESHTDVVTGTSSEKKSLIMRPSSALRQMLQQYERGKSMTAPVHAAHKTLRSQDSRCRIWSGYSHVTNTSIISGHHSRCAIPGRHDIALSNSYTISGPHSSLYSLLGDSPRPPSSSKEMHHMSAWYHVPGRYAIPQERCPKKRMQRTDSAKAIEAFILLKSQWAKENEARVKVTQSETPQQEQLRIESQSKTVANNKPVASAMP